MISNRQFTIRESFGWLSLKFNLLVSIIKTRGGLEFKRPFVFRYVLN